MCVCERERGTHSLLGLVLWHVLTFLCLFMEE